MRRSLSNLTRNNNNEVKVTFNPNNDGFPSIQSVENIQKYIAYLEKKTENKRREQSVGCQGNLETLHQFSGQCWNDASIIYLWFASGIGPKVQVALQDERTVGKFREWIHSKPIKDQLLHMYSITEDNYDKFTEKITNYLYCLQKRYQLWLSLKAKAFKKEKRSLERQESQCFSMCGEQSGKEAYALLTGRDLKRKKNEAKNTMMNRLANTKEYVKKIHESVADFGLDNTEEAELEKRILQISEVEEGGYTGAFTNVLFILMNFFLHGNLQLYALSQKKEYESVTIQYADKPMLFHDYITDKEYTFNRIFSILKKTERNTFHISFLGGFVSLKKTAHAVAFFICEDGNPYFYDDNNYVLVNIKWPLLFKGMDSSFEQMNPKVLSIEPKIDFIPDKKGYILMYFSRYEAPHFLGIPLEKPNTAGEHFPLFVRFVYFIEDGSPKIDILIVSPYIAQEYNYPYENYSKYIEDMFLKDKGDLYVQSDDFFKIKPEYALGHLFNKYDLNVYSGLDVAALFYDPHLPNNESSYNKRSSAYKFNIVYPKEKNTILNNNIINLQKKGGKKTRKARRKS